MTAYSAKEFNSTTQIPTALTFAHPDLGSNESVSLTKELDCSGGGTAQTETLFTVPEDSILFGVFVEVTEAFDGDATTTVDIGDGTDADEYIANSDISDYTTVGTRGSSLQAGTDDDEVVYISADTTIKATWTNTASATAGKLNVTVVYKKVT